MPTGPWCARPDTPKPALAGPRAARAGEASHGRGSGRPAPVGDAAFGDLDPAGRALLVGPDRVRPGGQVRVDRRVLGPGRHMAGPHLRMRPAGPMVVGADLDLPAVQLDRGVQD